MQKLEREIVEKIKKEEIKMKPKVYFVLGGVLLGVGLGLVLLLAVFTANVGFYKLLFFRRFNLNIVLFIILFIGAGALLLKQYDFSYRKDFVWLVLALAVGVLLLGFGLSQTKINNKARKMRYIKNIYNNGYQLPPKLQRPAKHFPTLK